MKTAVIAGYVKKKRVAKRYRFTEIKKSNQTERSNLENYKTV